MKGRCFKTTVAVIMYLLFFGWGISASYAELLILTPQEFQRALDPLINHKRTTGMDTHLLTIETIYGSDLFDGADEPEQIKRAIAYYEQFYGTKYVMLVGDSDKFPVRYIAMAGDLGREPGRIVFGNTDLYYADLYKGDPEDRFFDDWNAGTSDYHLNYIGELHKTGHINYDQVDYHPDVAVGRVPASSEEEVKRYVDKVIDYETRSWFSTEFALVGGFEGGGGRQGNQASADHLTTTFSQAGIFPIQLYEPSWNVANTDSLEPALIFESIDRVTELGSQLKFMSMSGHGTPSGWGPYFQTQHVAQMDNATNLPVVFSASCDIARFAPKSDCETYETIYGDIYDPILGLLLFDQSGTSLSLSSLKKQKALTAEVAAGDIDGDGRDESVCATQTTSGEKMALFIEQNHPPLKRIGDVRIQDLRDEKVASGNFDTDAADEIVIVGQDGGNLLAILVYDYNGEMVRINDIRLNAFDPDIAVGNLNGNGPDELVLTCHDEQDRLAILVYEFQSSGQLVRTHDLRLQGSQGRPILLDMDGDGIDEIIVACIDKSKRIAVLIYKIGNSNTLTRIGDLRLNALKSPNLAGGDFNFDGNEDLIVLLQTTPTEVSAFIYTYHNSPKLARIAELHLAGNNAHVATGNFDDDPAEEFAIAMQDMNERTAVLIYDGVGSDLRRIGDVREKDSTPSAIITGQWDQDSYSNIAIWAGRNKNIRQDPPATIQPSHIDAESESMAEEFLVKHTGGAVAFVGASTGVQKPSLILEQYFFEAYTDFGDRVVGDMWNRAIEQYYVKYNMDDDWKNENNCSSKDTCWVRGAEFNTIQKTMLFGDPSLRLW